MRKRLTGFSDDFINAIDSLDSGEQVMGCLLQKIYELTELVRLAKQNPKHSPHVRKCMEYINANIGKRLTVDGVAAEAGLSADYLSHLFKKETGVNLSSYILTAKLNAAKTLIFEGASGSSACRALGFCSQSHFICAFKKQFGEMPGEFYRKINGGKAPDD